MTMCNLQGIISSDKPADNHPTVQLSQLYGRFYLLSAYCFGLEARNSAVLIHSHCFHQCLFQMQAAGIHCIAIQVEKES